MLLYVCVLLFAAAVATPSVLLFPLDNISGLDRSRNIGCKIQVVVEDEQQWSSASKVCIWADLPEFAATNTAVPSAAHCTHSASGSARFSAPVAGSYLLKAAIVQSKTNLKASETASIVATTDLFEDLEVAQHCDLSDQKFHNNVVPYAPEVTSRMYHETSVSRPDKYAWPVVVRSGYPGCP
jgi:hypothetical protein